MSERIFIARKRGGLCNNLKCYLSSMRYATETGSELVTDCTDLAMIYEDLSLVDSGSVPADTPSLSDWRLHVMPQDDLPVGFSRSGYARGYEGARDDGRNIDFEYDRVPESMRTIYLTLLRSLPIKKRLLDFIDRFAAERFEADTVSMHMRTWMTDHWDKAPKRHAHFFDYTAFESAIAARAPGKVFLSSDNAEYALRLRDRFGDSVITVPDNNGLHSTEFAFVNLVLLAKNSILYGSNVSTFTEMAWWYSGCRTHVKLL